MNLKEIENLDIKKYKMTLAVRVFNKMKPHPEPPKNPPHDFDYTEWTLSQISEEEFDKEFEMYKEELRLKEVERVRRSDLEDRFNSLIDMRASFHSLYPSKSNPAIFLRDLLNSNNHEDAEFKITELENKDFEINNSIEKRQSIYIESRNREYLKEGVSRDVILEALWEAVVEKRTDKIDQLQPIREKVKNKIPKPE